MTSNLTCLLLFRITVVVHTHYGYSRAYAVATLYLYFQVSQSLPELLLPLFPLLYLMIRQGKSSTNSITVRYWRFQLFIKKILMKADEQIVRWQFQYQGPMRVLLVNIKLRHAIARCFTAFNQE